MSAMSNLHAEITESAREHALADDAAGIPDTFVSLTDLLAIKRAAGIEANSDLEDQVVEVYVETYSTVRAALAALAAAAVAAAGVTP